MFVIKNTEHGKWVSKPGKSSYTRYLQFARTWPTRAAAERERCIVNEKIQRVADILAQPEQTELDNDIAFF